MFKYLLILVLYHSRPLNMLVIFKINICKVSRFCQPLPPRFKRFHLKGKPLPFKEGTLGILYWCKIFYFPPLIHFLSFLFSLCFFYVFDTSQTWLFILVWPFWRPQHFCSYILFWYVQFLSCFQLLPEHFFTFFSQKGTCP